MGIKCDPQILALEYCTEMLLCRKSPKLINPQIPEWRFKKYGKISTHS
jgi:hypothetical protein